jgi:hypothetical protein
MMLLGGRSCIIEFGIPLKLARLTKVCLNETYELLYFLADKKA